MDEPKILDEDRSARCFCPYVLAINGDPTFSFQTVSHEQLQPRVARVAVEILSAHCLCRRAKNVAAA